MSIRQNKKRFIELPVLNPKIPDCRLQVANLKHKIQNLKSEIRNNFTLIELLVVIAIISILMAMLLPALSSARKMSKQTVCNGNMKQMSLVTQNYFSDFGGLCPPIYSGDAKRTWPYYFYYDGYITNPYAALVCPVQKPYPTLSLLGGYALCGYNKAALPSKNYEWWISNYPSKETFYDVFSYKNTSSLPLLCDSLNELDNQTYYMEGSGAKKVHLRHFKSAMILFYDGHAESCSAGHMAELGNPNYFYLTPPSTN